MARESMKPEAYLHELTYETGDKTRRVTFTEQNPWGVQGVNYSSEFEVVTTPLFALDPDKEFKRRRKLEERRARDRAHKQAMLKRYGLTNLKPATWRLYGIRNDLANEQWVAGHSLFELYRAHGVLLEKDWKLAQYEEEKGFISFEKTEGKL